MNKLTVHVLFSSCLCLTLSCYLLSFTCFTWI